jgi:predicted DNA-binding protein
MKNETIVIRVDKKLKDRLQKLAEKDRRKLSDYIRIVLEDLING